MYYLPTLMPYTQGECMTSYFPMCIPKTHGMHESEMFYFPVFITLTHIGWTHDVLLHSAHSIHTLRTWDVMLPSTHSLQGGCEMSYFPVLIPYRDVVNDQFLISQHSYSAQHKMDFWRVRDGYRVSVGYLPGT